MFRFALLWWAGFHILGLFFWILVLVGICFLISRMVTRSHAPRQVWYRSGVPPMQPSASGAPTQPSALEILCQRYARGEIDATTFDQMRERLQATLKQE